MSSIRLTRVAGQDGVQHANRTGASRTLCGIRAMEERYGWPAKTRCPECVAAAEALLHAARDRQGAPISR